MIEESFFSGDIVRATFEVLKTIFNEGVAKFVVFYNPLANDRAREKQESLLLTRAMHSLHIYCNCAG